MGLASMLALTACGSSSTDTDDASSSGQVSHLSVDRGDAGAYTLSWDGAGEATVFASTSVTDPSENGREVATGDGAATVDGLDPIDRWYFEASTGDGTGDIASTRQFFLQGAHNVRDMGGFTTKDGHTTAWGKVFRADSLTELTDEDDAALAAADVATVVDYRGKSEIAKNGQDQLPASTKYVNLPVLDKNTEALSNAIQKALKTGNQQVMQDMLGDGKARQIGDEGFVDQLNSPKAMAAYGKTLELIANSDGALMYHCTSGKDRTGMMSALLLGILGVSDEAIIDDFVASNTYNREHNEKTYKYLEGKGVDISLVKPLMEQRPSQIKPVLDAVHNTYGGWDKFAHDVLGLDSQTLTQLRDKMLV
ncbi:tyrosine-protein phosphatase [Tomitella gaofuii]|uniref:tyrosine-protein phosphatase n=1 Tax=Tomitella gaofuii TaxID=2760083 RepID=UPI0015FB2212|nr:tyrosine-protein phosphatase [Tomitella gaofuii]